MNYLFFFVHPSKFYVFRNTINSLIQKGHKVDILITSKDVLEDLIKTEKWNYTNIFPEGRVIKTLPKYISLSINYIRTIYRLYKFVKNKKYDLFITDDLLVYIGKLKKVKTVVFSDDDLSVTKKFALILSKAHKVLSPDITDLGKYNFKKIGVPSYKELAYLHPNVYKPNIDNVKIFNPELKPYFIIRLVSLNAYHDVGKKGLSNENVKTLISFLEQKGKVYITSEKELDKEFKKYQLNINPINILDVLSFAELFIGDSQTMTSEAAVLGIPAFRCNDFVGKISVMEEKEQKYGLSFNFLPQDFDKMLEKIKEILNNQNFKNDFNLKKEKMISDKIDLSAFMIWLFENYNNIDFESINFENFNKNH